MKYKILNEKSYRYVTNFNIKQNGIQIIDNDEKIEIYNDPFRTIPLFIATDINGQFIIFSNFEDFYEFKDINKTIDEAGFWEIVLFGSGLWTRTLYANVKQMPSASKITIDKKTNEYKIKRYWDFNVEVDESIDSIEKAAKGLYDRLDVIFSKLDRNQKYVMGMSGGMDSRITLAFLSKYIPRENLELFTYGFDERLLEYKYACEVADALGYNKPKFHKLTKESYKNAMDYLPQMSGGQIGINHSHFNDVLLKINSNKQILSNHYLEVLFNVYGNETKFNLIQKVDRKVVGEKNYNIISDDINKMMGHNNTTRYWYESERQAKFHSCMDYLYCVQTDNSICDIYRDYDLFVFSKSIPQQFNTEKKIQDFILLKYFNINQQNISSSRFGRGNIGRKKIDLYYFKFLNRINALLRPLTKGHLQLFNKYQTEELDRLLYRDFHDDLKSSTSQFVKMGIMTKEQKNYWDRLPLRSNGIGERFGLISLAKLI